VLQISFGTVQPLLLVQSTQLLFCGAPGATRHCESAAQPVPSSLHATQRPLALHAGRVAERAAHQALSSFAAAPADEHGLQVPSLVSQKGFVGSPAHSALVVHSTHLPLAGWQMGRPGTCWQWVLVVHAWHSY
jgi:hypothetical protein